MILVMTEADMTRDWEETIGARVRDAMASAEMGRYFSVKMTPARARGALLQLSLFVQLPTTHWSYSSFITWVWLKRWRNWTELGKLRGILLTSSYG